MGYLQKIQFVCHKVKRQRRHYVNEGDVKVILSRLPEELWAPLRKVYFKDDGRARRFGYVTTRGRREITLCALPYQVTPGPRIMGAEEFGAVRRSQWPTLAVRRLMLYEVFLHELGHLQVVRPKSKSPRRKFADETLAQQFADRWRRKLWSQQFDHPDPVHSPPTEEELRVLKASWIEANLAYRKGSALRANGKKGEAIPHLRRAIELYPDHALAMDWLGTLIYNGHDSEIDGFSREASLAVVPVLKRAIKLDPQLSGAHLILASALGRLDNHPACREAFERALSLPVPYRFYRNEVRAEYADVLSRWGCEHEAETMFRQVLKENSRNTNALQDYASMLIRSKRARPAEAVTLLLRALAIAKKKPATHYYLARAYSLLPNQQAAAILHAREALRLHPEYQSLPALIDRLLQQGSATV